jgi:hypothetical protein
LRALITLLSGGRQPSDGLFDIHRHMLARKIELAELILRLLAALCSRLLE